MSRDLLRLYRSIREMFPGYTPREAWKMARESLHLLNLILSDNKYS